MSEGHTEAASALNPLSGRGTGAEESANLCNKCKCETVDTPAEGYTAAAAALTRFISPLTGAVESRRFYNIDSSSYDEYMEILKYRGPPKTAEVVHDLVKGDTSIKILDLGAGTGLVGVELVKLGYKNLDAVDAAENMLEVLKLKNIYDKVECLSLGSKDMPFQDDSYDLAVACGAMQENHIPKEAFRDVIRVVKPGGHVVLVFRAAAENAAWYQGDLGSFFSQLEQEGLWKLVTRSIFPYFIPEADGVVWVHQVLKAGKLSTTVDTV